VRLEERNGRPEVARGPAQADVRGDLDRGLDRRDDSRMVVDDGNDDGLVERVRVSARGKVPFRGSLLGFSP